MANRIIQPRPQSYYDRQKELFMEWAPKNGIPTSLFGENITIPAGRTFKIIGWDPTARRYCVVGERLGEISRISWRALLLHMEKNGIKRTR